MSLIKDTSRMLGGSWGHIAGSALGGVGELAAFRERVSQGQNPIIAGAIAAGSLAAWTTMGFLPALIVTNPGAIYNAGKALYNFSQNTRAWQREFRTPFSHSYQHTEATSMAQQRGLQQLGIARGLIGSEASMMAARYARR